MKKHISMRFASMLLILALFVGLIAPANAINPALQPASPAMALPRTSKQWPIAQI